MPKIATHKLLTFFLTADAPLNGTPHVYLVREKGGSQKSAKILLNTLEVADKGTQTGIDLKRGLKLIKTHQEPLTEAYNKVKKGKEVTTLKLKLK